MTQKKENDPDPIIIDNREGYKQQSYQGKPLLKGGWISRALFFVLLALAMLFWGVFSLLLMTFDLIGYILSLFRAQKALDEAVKHLVNAFKAVTACIGALLCIITPNLGLWAVMAFYQKREKASPFSQYIHAILKGFKK